MEVLSTSIKVYDKTDKFRMYRSIPEFEEYILIDQTAYRVEQYTKVGQNQWLMTEILGQDGLLVLQSVNAGIKLTDLYLRVNFARPHQ